jgi:hypothetical protein
MKRTVLALSLLCVLAGTAPASAAFLGENPRLAESFPNMTFLRVSADVSRELPQGSGGSCLERPAECFVAPSKPSTLEPGPYAKESIPAHPGKPTAAEQSQINELMQKNGCHTCGTKNPGTQSGNAIGDHQPPQALGEPKEFYPHCIDCMRRQGGEVRQKLLKGGGGG